MRPGEQPQRIKKRWIALLVVVVSLTMPSMVPCIEAWAMSVGSSFGQLLTPGDGSSDAASQ